MNEQLVTQAEADGMLAVIRSERGTSGIANDAADGDDDAVLVGAPPAHSGEYSGICSGVVSDQAS